MHITGASGGSALLALQRLFQDAGGGGSAGQDLPIAGQETAIAQGGSCGSSTPQIGAQTMAAVMQLQTQPPSDSDLADGLISSLDANGDGTVSLDEIQAAFKDAGIDTDASSAFSQIDSNGDGQLDSSELTSAVSNARAHHHHHGGPPSATDQASSILSEFDTDGTTGLSLDEASKALGQSGDALTSTFSALDTDGDGALSAQELEAAINTQMLTAQRAYAAQISTQTSAI